MATRQLSASINDQRVGTLSDNNGRWSFSYAPVWLNDPGGFSLSPQLPLREQPHEDDSSNRQVQWYFDNLLPEEGQRTLLASDAQIERADAFSLLAFYGAESAGSLTLLPAGEPGTDQGHGKVPLSDEVLEERIKQLPSLPLTHGASKRMSLAGAQHKLAVMMDQATLFEPTGQTASTHILKPNHPSIDFAQSVINEWFVMTLAAKMSLDTPNVYRRYIPSAIYLIERFDRQHQDNEVMRLHSIDACQLLGLDSAFKYQQGSMAILDTIAKACRSTALARTRLYSWVIFNVLVGNTDAHLKNLSFMVDHEGIELAPFYDLLSTGVYETAAFDGSTWPEKSTLAWPLTGAAFVSDIERDIMINAGQELGLNKSTSVRLLDFQLQRLMPAARALYADMLLTNPSGTANRSDEGIRWEAESRCVRSIIHAVIEPMVIKLSR